MQTDIAKAAGVVWDDEPPLRMRLLQAKHDELMALDLTMNDVKVFHDYVAQLTNELAQEGENLKRKFRMAMAKRNRTKDAKRAAAYDKSANAIFKAQDVYNKEVKMTQFEMDWLLNSPAFKKMLEFRAEHWIETPRGDFVSKKDLEEDAEVSFDSLLAEFKNTL